MLQDDDGTATGLLNPIKQGVEVAGDTGGEDHDGLAEATNRILKTLEVGALSGQLDIGLEGQDAGYAGPKDDLIISQNDLQCHREFLLRIVIIRNQGS